MNDYVSDGFQEFLVHLIHRERSKAEELLAAEEGSIISIEMSRELLTDPLIFLRKWLGEVRCLDILTCMPCVTLFTLSYLAIYAIPYMIYLASCCSILPYVM